MLDQTSQADCKRNQNSPHPRSSPRSRFLEAVVKARVHATFCNCVICLGLRTAPCSRFSEPRDGKKPAEGGARARGWE